MTSYTTLNVARPYIDPVHKGLKTKTVKFDAADREGNPLRRIEREQGVVTITCIKSGRVVEVPWSACTGGVVDVDLREAVPEPPRDPLYPPSKGDKRVRRPREPQP